VAQKHATHTTNPCAWCLLQMLAEAVGHHVASFPAGARGYRLLVDVLGQLWTTGSMTAIDAGQVAAKLVAGQVPDGLLGQMRERLAKCGAGSQHRQRWILLSCL
jgi:hypothetical protein